MGWVQLGLFLDRNLPKKVSKPVKKVSKSKPIPKKRDPKVVTLAPGELDDPLDDIL